MTLDNAAYAVLVMNHERTCSACEKAVPMVLRQGYWLLVWTPGAAQPVPMEGKGIIA